MTSLGDMAPREAVKDRRPGAEQRKRREEALARQKGRRASALAQSRGLLPATVEDVAPAPMSDAPPADRSVTDGMDMAHLGDDAQPMVQDRGSRSAFAPAPAACPLMTAEWMVDVPADLTRSWYVTARPAGRWCIVTASGGSTRAQGRTGKPRTFPSALPNGSRATRSGLSMCQLSCIWSEPEQTYYVIDLLSWKDHRQLDCPAEFRLYWLASKLSETRAAEVSSRNPCRFVVLFPSECTADSLRAAYASPPPFGAPRDGLLFMHRDALYEVGPSPLLLAWSDASCSARFYDYGSEQMAQAVERTPEKAEKWRTDEVDAAITFDDLLRCAEQPPMEMEPEDVQAAEPVDMGVS
jgi:snurportin-1